MKESKLLIIEDNEGDIFLMTEVTQEMGLNDIVIKKDGKAALDFLQHTDDRPNLIFLDINLPKINGFEVLEFIRSTENLQDIPVVIFSTSSSKEDIVKAYHSNASCFLTKNENFDDFQQVMSKSINFWLTFSMILEKSKKE